MILDPNQLSASEAYATLIGAVVPRPIAWVSSVDGHGAANLAPYSFYGGVSSRPMTVMLSVGRRNGREKDTGNNLKATGEAVIHVPNRALAELMVQSAAELPPEVDEFEHCGLVTLPSTKVAPPRIAGAPIAMEARVSHHMEVGEAPMDMFLLEVLLIHVDDAVINEQGRIDAQALAACGRLGGLGYTTTDSGFFELARP
ncbi:MAG: flavin reductase family protein [Gammaproteobacteria bacterium]